MSNIINIEEADGSPSVWTWKIKMPDGSLTDNGDGTVTYTGGGTITGDLTVGSSTAGKNVTIYATLGDEKITWTAAGWNEDAHEWTVAGTPVVITHVADTGHTTALTSTLASAIVAGVTYKVVIVYTQVAGTCTYTLGGVSGTALSTTGATVTDYITAATTAQMIITPVATSNIVISSISIKALTDATGDLTVDGNLNIRSPFYAYGGGTLYNALNEAKGTDVASGTNIDIGIATGNFIDITGTTTIASLGTIQAGTRRIVRFIGALTLTYNATSLILPGARDITTEAGDRAEFVSLGSGNWLCVAFLKNNGRVLGDVIVLTNGATADITSSQMRGQTHLVTGAYTLDLPTAAVGLSSTFIATTAAVFSLDLETGTDIIILNGVALTAGNKVTTDGTVNATLYVESSATGYYRVNTIVGVASDGGA